VLEDKSDNPFDPLSLTPLNHDMFSNASNPHTPLEKEKVQEEIQLESISPVMKR